MSGKHETSLGLEARTLSSQPPVTSSPPYTVARSGMAERGSQTYHIWGGEGCLARCQGQVPIPRLSARPLLHAHPWEVKKDPEGPRVTEEERLREEKIERGMSYQGTENRRATGMEGLAGRDTERGY